MSRSTLRLLRPQFARTIPRLSPSTPSVCFTRSYSIHADHAAPRLQDIDPSHLRIERTLSPKQLCPPEELVFGREFTGYQFAIQ
jgi:hypothetical protein